MKTPILTFSPALLSFLLPFFLHHLLELHRLEIDPILAADNLFFAIQLRDHITLQALQHHLIFRPCEIAQTIARVVCLLARRTDHAVNVTPQQPVRELDHRIAQVHDAVAWQRLHVQPGRFLPGGHQGWRRQDLQAAETVEQDRQTAEVGVLPQSRTLLLGERLRGRLDEAGLVAGAFGEAVLGRQGALGKVQVAGEVVQNQVDEGMRSGHVRDHEILVVVQELRVREWLLREAEKVVLGDLLLSAAMLAVVRGFARTL